MAPGRLGRVAGRWERLQPALACPPAHSELTLSHIGVWASGEWECSVSTVQGNASKKVEIVVLETSASYCPAERVANNRGDFRFKTQAPAHTPLLPLGPPVTGPPPTPSWRRHCLLSFSSRSRWHIYRDRILLYKITLRMCCAEQKGFFFLFLPYMRS